MNEGAEAIYGGTATLEVALANGRRLLDRDPRAAAAQAQEILFHDGENGDARRLLGQAMRRLGRHVEAAAAELDAIRASSRNPNMVQAAQAVLKGNLKEGERLIRAELSARPDDPAAIRILAEIAARTGALEDAEAMLRQAIALAPAYASARLRLVKLYVEENRLADALEALDALLDVDPGNFKAHGFKAAALAKTGDYADAVALYERLLERAPEKPRVWMSYGHILNTVGRLADSVAAYRRALAIDPTLGEAWWSLANLKTARFDSADIEAMAGALAGARADGGLDDSDRLHIHFALGKAFEDSAEFERSFGHYSDGNRIRKEMLDYRAETLSRTVQRSKALFTAEFFSAREGQGCPAPDPIFIVGLPRSGSTLLEQILSSHSMVEGTSELPHIPAMRQRLEAEGPFPEHLAQLPPERLRELGEDYLQSASIHRKTGAPFFIDKLPNNWLNLGLIRLILPNAKIVDARRHPMGCCFSNFKQHFAHGQAFSYSLEDLGAYYRDYVETLAHFDRVAPGAIHRVFHERMVDDSETEIRRLLEHLGLPFEEACLRFWENDRAVRTPSAEQVRRPINREGVERWKAYEPWLGPLKSALGPVLECYPEVPESRAD
jgi:tetratricopeptide (TPR) repeat protein